MSAPLIEIDEITKVYQMGEVKVRALRGVSLDVQPGEVLSVMGPSGSGKSTLMNIIGCLDQPTSGTYLLERRDVSQLDDDQLAAVRNHKIGFVFQTFNLLARTTAFENVALPLIYAGVDRSERRERAAQALEAVGLEHRMDHTPNELSGGQQQRVAIARALINRPAILLADEPTGNLDSQAAGIVFDIFEGLAARGKTIIMVTHDVSLAHKASRCLQISDGAIISDDRIADKGSHQDRLQEPAPALAAEML